MRVVPMYEKEGHLTVVPYGPNRWFRCIRCWAYLSSLPQVSVSCRCGNIGYDWNACRYVDDEALAEAVVLDAGEELPAGGNSATPLPQIDDGGACEYFAGKYSALLTAIGWLDDTHPFKTGQAEEGVSQRLAELANYPWIPPGAPLAASVYSCAICLPDEFIGRACLFIPSGSTVFVCPDLITHYMGAHNYCPPREFCKAVMQCPEMDTSEYMDAFLALARPLAETIRRRG